MRSLNPFASAWASTRKSHADAIEVPSGPDVHAGVGYVYDDVSLSHETGRHLESPERLRTIMGALEDLVETNRLVRIPPRRAALTEVAWAHAHGYICQVRDHSARAEPLDPDTPVSRSSYGAALWAAGGAMAGVDAVLTGEVRRVFVLARPPGHHATASRAMGFCLFNNIAIAAHRALNVYGCERIFILDWDAHHGNGTQSIFWHDPRVYVCSLHESPGFPGTGGRDEIGGGAGRGTTLNVPLPAGSRNDDYLGVLRREVQPRLHRFRPDLILVSAGQDAHAADPLANMRLDEQGFADMTRWIMEMAEEVCTGKLAFILEGGYDPVALARSVRAIFEVMLGDR